MIQSILESILRRLERVEYQAGVNARLLPSDVIIRSDGTAMPVVVVPQAGGTMALTNRLPSGGTAGYAAFWSSGTTIVSVPMQKTGTALLTLNLQLQGTVTIPGPGTVALTSNLVGLSALAGGTAGHAAFWGGGTSIVSGPLQRTGTALLTLQPQLQGTFTIPAPGTAAMLDRVNAFTTSQSIAGSANLTGDVFTKSDSFGLFARAANWGRVPTDHFTSFTGWTWASSPFNSAPTTVDTTTLPSVLYLIDSSTTNNHFAYKSYSGGSPYLFMESRLSCGVNSYMGIRCDDGTDNNFYELRFTSFMYTHRYRAGGGAVTEGTLQTFVRAEWVLFRIYKDAVNNLGYIGYDSPIPQFLSAPHAAWSPTRAGLIFGQRGIGGNGDRGGLVDWFLIT